ncbi:hypothetical protein ACWDOP_33085 [Nocardia sp. NPDC003693]
MTATSSRLDHHPVSSYRTDLRYPEGLRALLHPHRNCRPGPGHHATSCARLRQLLEIADRNNWHWAKRILNPNPTGPAIPSPTDSPIPRLEQHTVPDSEPEMTQTEAIEARVHHRDCDPPCPRSRAAAARLHDDFGPKHANILQFPDRAQTTSPRPVR